jgi:hypothetical protein
MTPGPAGFPLTQPPPMTLRTRLVRLSGPLLVAALALGVAACGGENVPKAIPDSGATLEGTVKVGGEQLQFAMVMVKSANGVASGKIGEDGKYKVSNVPLGEVQIGVNTTAAQGEYQSAVMQAGAMTGAPDGGGKTGRKKVDVKMIHVKEQYYEPTSSGLKTTVKAGANTYDIELPANARK